MKIIFDSEEQKKRMLMCLAGILEPCPSDFDLNDESLGDCHPGNRDQCFECWKRCGLDMEVRTDNHDTDSLDTLIYSLLAKQSLNSIKFCEEILDQVAKLEYLLNMSLSEIVSKVSAGYSLQPGPSVKASMSLSEVLSILAEKEKK